MAKFWRVLEADMRLRVSFTQATPGNLLRLRTRIEAWDYLRDPMFVRWCQLHEAKPSEVRRQKIRDAGGRWDVEAAAEAYNRLAEEAIRTWPEPLRAFYRRMRQLDER